ncbi:hypothetical protein SDC49_01305 [Lactobacillus sp. R2/2]|nr:hypothetical protein [Lactobacillus sp. R2/2]
MLKHKLKQDADTAKTNLGVELKKLILMMQSPMPVTRLTVTILLLILNRTLLMVKRMF